MRNIFEIFMEIMLANEWEKVQMVLTFSGNVNIITMKNKEGILRGRVLKESVGILYFRGFFEEIKLFGDNLVTF